MPIDKRLPVMALAALAFIGFSRPAHAGLSLTLQNGGSTVSIADNDANDACGGLAGLICYIGSVGSNFVSLTSGLSKPLNGPGTLTLNSVDVQFSPLGGALTITLSDTGFTSPIGNIPMLLNVNSTQLTSNGQLTVTGYQQNESSGSPLNSTGPIEFNGPGDETVFTNPLNVVGPYTLTQVATIAFSGFGSISFDSTLSFTPEPASLILIGSVFLFTAHLLRQRVTRRA